MFGSRILESKSIKLFVTSITALGLSIITGTEARAYSLPKKEVLARGGPFVIKRTKPQRYIFSFDITERELKRPLDIVLYNGSSAKPGFRRVRVFLERNFSENLVTQKRLPSKRLVFATNRMTKRTTKVDISRRLKKGINTIVIEGRGPKGAVISLELEALPHLP